VGIPVRRIGGTHSVAWKGSRSSPDPEQDGSGEQHHATVSSALSMRLMDRTVGPETRNERPEGRPSAARPEARGVLLQEHCIGP